MCLKFPSKSGIPSSPRSLYTSSNTNIKGHITSEEEVQKALETKGKLVVLEFMEATSELYKFMVPAVEDIAQRYRDYADFYTLDQEKLKDFAGKQEVEVLPTFLVCKDGVEQKRIVGIKKGELEESIEELKGAPAVPEPNIPDTKTATLSDCIIL